ncbi:unnamed protein product [Linum trigynum]|uniref:Uncharacterized protein n=1 Tax=Linum trigynum TaxID=586398 RepID=A0AAV2FHL0_9ROSI
MTVEEAVKQIAPNCEGRGGQGREDRFEGEQASKDIHRPPQKNRLPPQQPEMTHLSTIRQPSKQQHHLGEAAGGGGGGGGVGNENDFTLKMKQPTWKDQASQAATSKSSNEQALNLVAEPAHNKLGPGTHLGSRL